MKFHKIGACCRADADTQKASTSDSQIPSSTPNVGVPIDRRVAASIRCVTFEMRLTHVF
jgi:hypothetical protein